MYWVGLPLALAISLFLVPAGARGLRDAGLVRENYRGALLAFPLGAVLATAALVALAPLAFLDDRADLDLLRAAYTFGAPAENPPEDALASGGAASGGTASGGAVSGGAASGGAVSGGAASGGTASGGL